MLSKDSSERNGIKKGDRIWDSINKAVKTTKDDKGTESWFKEVTETSQTQKKTNTQELRRTKDLNQIQPKYDKGKSQCA